MRPVQQRARRGDPIAVRLDVLAQQRPERPVAHPAVQRLQEARAPPVDHAEVRRVGRVVVDGAVDVAAAGAGDRPLVDGRREVRPDLAVVDVRQVRRRTPRPATDRRSDRCRPTSRTTGAGSRAGRARRGRRPPAAIRARTPARGRSGPDTPARRSWPGGPRPPPPAPGTGTAPASPSTSAGTRRRGSRSNAARSSLVAATSSGRPADRRLPHHEVRRDAPPPGRARSTPGTASARPPARRAAPSPRRAPGGWPSPSGRSRRPR